jgi:hypothetical protein
MKITLNKTRLGCKYRGPIYYHEGATMESSTYQVSKYGTWWCINKNSIHFSGCVKTFRSLRECKAWVSQQIAIAAA